MAIDQSQVETLIVNFQERQPRLEQHEEEARNRLALVECYMPSILAWNVWRALEAKQLQARAQKLESENQRLCDRVEILDNEKKKAQDSLGITRTPDDDALSLSVETCRDRIKEGASPLVRADVGRLGQNTGMATVLLKPDAVNNVANEISNQPAATSHVGLFATENELSLLPETSALSENASPEEFERIKQLQQMAANEMEMKKRIEQMERRENVYMEALQRAEELCTLVSIQSEDDMIVALQILIPQLEAENRRLRDLEFTLEGQLKRLNVPIPQKILEIRDDTARYQGDVRPVAQPDVTPSPAVDQAPTQDVPTEFIQSAQETAEVASKAAEQAATTELADEAADIARQAKELATKAAYLAVPGQVQAGDEPIEVEEHFEPAEATGEGGQPDDTGQPEDSGMEMQPGETEEAPQPDDTGGSPQPEDTEEAPQPEDTEEAPQPEDTEEAPQPDDTEEAPQPDDTGGSPQPEDTEEAVQQSVEPMPEETIATPQPTSEQISREQSGSHQTALVQLAEETAEIASKTAAKAAKMPEAADLADNAADIAKQARDFADKIADLGLKVETTPSADEASVHYEPNCIEDQVVEEDYSDENLEDEAAEQPETTIEETGEEKATTVTELSEEPTVQDDVGTEEAEQVESDEAAEALEGDEVVVEEEVAEVPEGGEVTEELEADEVPEELVEAAESEVPEEVEETEVPAEVEVTEEPEAGDVPEGVEATEEPEAGDVPEDVEVTEEPEAGDVPEEVEATEEPEAVDVPEEVDATEELEAGDVPEEEVTEESEAPAPESAMKEDSDSLCELTKMAQETAEMAAKTAEIAAKTAEESRAAQFTPGTKICTDIAKLADEIANKAATLEDMIKTGGEGGESSWPTEEHTEMDQSALVTMAQETAEMASKTAEEASKMADTADVADNAAEIAKIALELATKAADLTISAKAIEEFVGENGSIHYAPIVVEDQVVEEDYSESEFTDDAFNEVLPEDEPCETDEGPEDEPCEPCETDEGPKDEPCEPCETDEGPEDEPCEPCETDEGPAETAEVVPAEGDVEVPTEATLAEMAALTADAASKTALEAAKMAEILQDQVTPENADVLDDAITMANEAADIAKQASELAEKAADSENPEIICHCSEPLSDNEEMEKVLVENVFQETAAAPVKGEEAKISQEGGEDIPPLPQFPPIPKDLSPIDELAEISKRLHAVFDHIQKCPACREAVGDSIDAFVLKLDSMTAVLTGSCPGPSAGPVTAEEPAGAPDVSIPSEGPPAAEEPASAPDVSVPSEGPLAEEPAGAPDVSVPSEGPLAEEEPAGAPDDSVPSEGPPAEEEPAGAPDDSVPSEGPPAEEEPAPDVSVPSEGPPAAEEPAGAPDESAPSVGPTAVPISLLLDDTPFQMPDADDSFLLFETTYSRTTADDFEFGPIGSCLLEPAKPFGFTDSQLALAFDEEVVEAVELGSKEQLFQNMFPDIAAAVAAQQEAMLADMQASPAIPAEGEPVLAEAAEEVAEVIELAEGVPDMKEPTEAEPVTVQPDAPEAQPIAIPDAALQLPDTITSDSNLNEMILAMSKMASRTAAEAEKLKQMAAAEPGILDPALIQEVADEAAEIARKASDLKHRLQVLDIGDTSPAPLKTSLSFLKGEPIQIPGPEDSFLAFESTYSRTTADNFDFGPIGSCVLEPAKPFGFTDSQLAVAFDEEVIEPVELGSHEELFQNVFPGIVATIAAQEEARLAALQQQQLEGTAGPEESAPAETVVTEAAPDEAAEPSEEPAETEAGPEEAPLETEAGPEEAPPETEAGPEEAPPETEAGPEEAPPETEAGPEEAPPETEAGPEEAAAEPSEEPAEVEVTEAGPEEAPPETEVTEAGPDEAAAEPSEEPAEAEVTEAAPEEAAAEPSEEPAETEVTEVGAEEAAEPTEEVGETEPDEGVEPTEEAPTEAPDTGTTAAPGEVVEQIVDLAEGPEATVPQAPAREPQPILEQVTEDVVLNDLLVSLQKRALSKSNEILEIKQLLGDLDRQQKNLMSTLGQAGPSGAMPIPEIGEGSGMIATIAALQDKCRLKDHLIGVMVDELRTRTQSGVWENLLTNIAAPGSPQPDFTRSDVSERLRTGQDKPSAPKLPCDCGNQRQTGQECPIAPNMPSFGGPTIGVPMPSDSQCVCPTDFRIIRQIGFDSLLLSWKACTTPCVVGYEIYVNGILAHKVRSNTRDRALLQCLDMSCDLDIKLFARLNTGQLTGGAQITYSVQR